MEKNKDISKVYLLAKSIPIDGSNNSEKVVAAAGRFDYYGKNSLELYKNMDNSKSADIIRLIKSRNEEEFLGHINFTFGVENLSKECAMEILNYSLASSVRNNDLMPKPNYYDNNLLVTMNALDLLDFFNDNCCTKAGEELNDVASKMLDICLNEAPNIFKDAGAPCTFGECDKENTCEKKKNAKIKQIIRTY